MSSIYLVSWVDIIIGKCYNLFRHGAKSIITDSTAEDPQLIVALDYDNFSEVKILVEELGDSCNFYKIGYQLFMHEGRDAISRVLDMGKKVFLDLKLYDIPNTIGSAVKAIPEGVSMLSIHGDIDAVKACVHSRPDLRPFFIYELSSEIQNEDDFDEDETAQSWYDVLEAGAKGFIVSGILVEFASRLRDEVKTIRDAQLLSPGIRLEHADSDDHLRSLTPQAAKKLGVDYIVVGRPITRAANKREALKQYAFPSS